MKYEVKQDKDEAKIKVFLEEVADGIDLVVEDADGDTNVILAIRERSDGKGVIQFYDGVGEEYGFALESGSGYRDEVIALGSNDNLD